MVYNNINLWFAKDTNGKIITIDEVDKELKNTYYCPLCESEVIARQGDIMSWHFAHIDKSKCDSESMIHFWIKNKLLEIGDTFTIKTDENLEFVVKDILIEQKYDAYNKVYNPDITVIAECGETIYFEVTNTNKKKVEEYLDIWIELGNIVVEVDSKDLINSQGKSELEFKSLYYDGKCFNINKSDIYYDTIGKYKEELNQKGLYGNKKEDVKKLDWFWNDIKEYNTHKNIEKIFNIIELIEDDKEKYLIFCILRKHKYKNLNILEDYYDFKRNTIINHILDKFGNNFYIRKIGESKYLRNIPEYTYEIESKICDCVNNSLSFWEKFNLYENTNNIINKISKGCRVYENKLKCYVNLNEKVKKIDESIGVSFSNWLYYNGLKRMIIDLESDIINIKQKSQKINEFLSKVNNIINTMIFDDIDYTLFVIDEECLSFKNNKSGNKYRLYANDDDDTIVSIINKSCLNKEELIKEEIIKYFYDEISVCGYKEDDIECYYNGFGNIVIRIKSIQFGNRCFRIRDDLDNSELYKLDPFIQTTIEKATSELKKEKRRIRKKLKNEIEDNMIADKLDMYKLNVLLSKKYDTSNILCDENDLSIVVYYGSYHVLNLIKFNKERIKNNSKFQILKQIYNQINCIIIKENMLNKIDSILLMLEKFEIIYSNITTNLNGKTFFKTKISLGYDLSYIDFSIQEDNYDYFCKATIKNNKLQINENDYTYDSLEELKEKLNSTFSNKIRGKKYGGVCFDK